MSTRPTPWSIEAEQNVLGAVMLENAVFTRCNVAAGDFYLARHRVVWQAMQRLYARRMPLDAVTVAEQLDADGQLESASLAYLAQLCRDTAAPQNGGIYADIVRQHAQVRRAQDIGKQLSKLEDAAELEAHIRALIELTQGSRDYTCSLSEAMAEAIDLLDKKLAATSTGLRDLDDALGGLHNGDLVVVGARAAMGKTAFMLNLALSASVPVGIISGEQGRDQIGLRAIAIDQEVSLHRMRSAKQLGDDEWTRITTAINAAKQKLIWMNDKPAPSIDEVVRQARAWKYEKNLGVLMVDYLQKLQGGAGDSVRERVGDIASQLKNLARELNIPVVALAQVNRTVESRPLGPDGLGRMPYMADLAECGIIEQEADSVLTLYRPGVYNPEPQFEHIAYVNICKNRHGPCGHKQVSWRGEFLKFGDLERHQAPSYPDRWSRHE